MHKRATLHGSSISQATSHDGAYTQTLAGSAERTASTRTEVVVDPKITTRHLAAIAPYRQHAGQSAAAAQGVRTGRTIPRGFDFDQGTYTHAPSRRSQQSGVPVWDDDVERRSRGRATMGRRIPLREWLSSLSFPGSAHDPRMRRHVSTRTALALFVSIVLWMAWLAWPSIAIGARSSATSRKGGFPKRVAGRSGSKSQAVLSETHVEDNDGMLRLNVTSRIHPIYQLMQNAAREWESKVSRQSKSLHEAVVEYRRRYGRPPPEGFDKWWHYVRENNVQLPDEYDQINNDLRLFWSISPEDLWDRVDAMRALSTTWTLSVRDGELYTSHKSDSETEGIMRMRIDGQVDLIRQIAGYLPDLDAVHNIDDAPSQFVGYNHRIELSHYIEDDEFADSNEEIDTTERGWQAGCSATSPLGIAARRAAGASRGRRPDLARTRPSKMAHGLEQKSFISNHRAAMDPCQHPDLMPIHSAFASKSPVVGPLMPLFSLSKTALHADIMGVPTEQVQENAMYIPWQHRHRDALLWRGSTTGPDHNEHVNWRSTQRTRLVKLGDTGSPTSTSGDLKILASADDLGQSTIAENAVTISQEDAKVRYMDVAFAGSPIQFYEDDGSCKALAEDYAFTSFMDVEEAAHYKYVIDVDGNAWSARFQRLISSGSVVFKSTVYPEWWLDRIQAWVHYVPIKVDYSDLYDTLAYFTGDHIGHGGHDEAAETIAEEAMEWSRAYMSREDMTAYAFRLYLEWGRLLSFDRAAASFVYDPSMEEATVPT